MKRQLVRCFLVGHLALAPWGTVPIRAASVGLSTDAELAEQADLVIVGRVLEAAPLAGEPAQASRISVLEVWAGELMASPIAVTVGAAVPLRLDERVVLFLDRPGRTGERAVLGAGAGAFQVGALDGRGVAYRRLRTSFEAELEASLAAGQRVVRNLEAFRHWIRARRAGSKVEADYLRGVSAAERAALESPVPLKVNPSGSVTDALGDASVLADLLSATISANATTLFVDIRYRTPGFATETITSIGLDTDQNAATGIVTDTGAGVYGVEASLRIGGADLGDQVQASVGSIVTGTFPATRGAGSYTFSLPLSAIADEGFFDFKVTTRVGNTGLREDLMPNRGSPPATTGEGVLAAPDTLRASVTGPDQIRLTWTDRANIEQQFEIERRLGGGAFQLIATVGANVEAYDDRSLADGQTYTYRVRARNGSEASDYSATASATIPSQGEAAPSDLTAQAVSVSEIQLGWSDNAAGEDGYRVEMRSTGDFELVQTLPADATTASIAGLEEATLYTFRVQATGGLGDSSYSNEASATTFVGEVEPCVPGPSTLCLSGGRFKVEIAWRDFAGNIGAAVDAGLDSADSGLLYFFDANNWEMLVKVLDGCAITNHFWVFAAATTNVEYTLTVTDTLTGAVKTYGNPLGSASPAITDTEAFATCGASAGRTSAGVSDAAEIRPVSRAAIDLTSKQGSCVPSATSLCLNRGRFRVEVDWVTADGAGMGQADAFQSADSGLLWFFSPNNLEMLVKVLDGCAINGRVWVFAAATTDVEYTLRVTDTVTGEEKRYRNAAGNAADAITDTDAFTACQ